MSHGNKNIDDIKNSIDNSVLTNKTLLKSVRTDIVSMPSH
jgi:hypothetical protein